MQNKIYQQKVEKYHSWNFTLNVASSGFESFAVSLVGTTTVLTVFLTLFTKSNLIIGLLPALGAFLGAFPQIVLPLYTARLREKKNFIVFFRMGYALPWLILAILNLFFPTPGSPVYLSIFFVFFSLFAIMTGVVKPMWVSFISRLIFPYMRGRFFALRLFIGTSFGVLGSFIVKVILEKYQYPLNFSLLFSFAFSMFLLGIIFLAISKEPLIPCPDVRRKPFSEYFTGLRDIIGCNKSFKWFVVSTGISSFGVIIMGAVFYTVYAIRELHISLGLVGIFMAITFSSQLVSALVLGYISDLKGPKVIVILGRLFEFLSAGVILLRGDIIGVYIAFGFLGLASACLKVSQLNMIIDLAPKDEVETYMGLVNGIRAPLLVIAPLIGGFLADEFSYTIVFTVALLGSLLSGGILVFKLQTPILTH